MLKYELKKLWNRPIVWITLLGVLICHIILINTNHLQYAHDNNQAYYEKYEGIMDETWQLNTIQKYNDYLSAHQMNDEQFNEYAKARNYSSKKKERLSNNLEARLLEEYKNSNEFSVLSHAYEAAHFKENIVNAIKNIKQQLLYRYPDLDTSIVDKTFANLLANNERFTFSMDYGYSIMEEALTIMIRSFVILMIVVLASLFTREQETNTLENILTTKNGRRKMQKCKLLAAFISAVLGWLIIIAVSLITIYITLGFDGGNMYVQDFYYNSCPYNLNSAQYLICILIISFLAAITIGACVALISAIVKKDSIAVILSIAMMLVPPFFNNNGQRLQDILYYHPSNMISGNYLLSYLNITKIGNHYIPSLYLALGILVFYIVVSYCFIYFRKPENYLYDSKSVSE